MKEVFIRIGKSVLARAVHFSLRASDSVAGGLFASESYLDRLGGDFNPGQRPAPLYPLGDRHHSYTPFNDWTCGCSWILYGRSRTLSAHRKVGRMVKDIAAELGKRR